MTRKLIFIIAILALALSACTTPATPTEMPTASEVDPTEVPEPTAVPPTPEPEPTEEPEPEVMIFTDDFGHTIELAEYPQRIVSISASTTEILFAIGAGDQVVGRDEYSLYPEAALEVENVGALWGEVPTETILALEPDLIVAAQIISEEQSQSLRDLGLNVYHQGNPLTYEDLYENLRDMAALTGHGAEAEALITDLDTRVQGVMLAIAPSSYLVPTFYELDATDPSSPWTTGAGTFIDYIISSAGGFNVASSLEGDFAQISGEELIDANPEVILLADALYGITPESVAERPGWDVIAAVQNGAIYPIDPNMMSVPGPRLVDALEETAKLLHPELFE